MDRCNEYPIQPRRNQNEGVIMNEFDRQMLREVHAQTLHSRRTFLQNSGMGLGAVASRRAAPKAWARSNARTAWPPLHTAG